MKIKATQWHDTLLKALLEDSDGTSISKDKLLQIELHKIVKEDELPLGMVVNRTFEENIST